MTRIRQRTLSDCGLTALSVYMAESLVRRTDPEWRGLAGLYNREIATIAKGCGFSLVNTRKFDLDTDEGVLRLRWTDKERLRASPEGHYVALIDACIHCGAEHVVMPWRQYLKTYGAVASSLIKGTL